MKKLFIFALCAVALNAAAQSEAEKVSFIKKYAPLAVAEMQKTGIPAAITMAQLCLETRFGTSFLFKKANNGFGMKMKKGWEGGFVYHNDDRPREKFRKYPDIDSSFRDHSKFLLERPNYKSLFLIHPSDYRAWAYGLKAAGYATNPRYASSLISCIETYNLCELDADPNPDYASENIYEHWPDAHR
jgi:flagellum-specific peptidoglycan hydrolase FlgJ